MDLKNLSAQYLTNNEPEKAIDLLIEYQNSKDVDLLNNLAIANILLNKKNNAISLFEKILAINPNFISAYPALGNLYYETGKADNAIKILELANSLNISSTVINKNLTIIYYKENLFAKARQLAQNILQNEQDNTIELILCDILDKEKNNKLLRKHAKNILKLEPENIDAKVYLATANTDLGYYEEIDNLLQDITPENEKYISVLYLKLKKAINTCDVTNQANLFSQLKSRINSKNIYQIRDPYYLLLAADNAKEVYELINIYSSNITNFVQNKYNHTKPSREKIRLGYISPNFNKHAVGFTLGNLIAKHDKTRFELYGILTFNPIEDFDRDIIYHFDKTVHLTDMPINEMAEKIYKLDIDILIDLTGYFAGSVMSVLACQPAKIQCHWMGYPGTLGADFIQYFISDINCLPKSNKKYYNETPLLLDTFVTAPQLDVPKDIATKVKYKLPEDKFIFCCHVREYRMSTELLDAWAKILNQTPESILWLSFASIEAKSNITQYLENQGVSNNRIIIADALRLSEDFAPQLADLWLDSFRMTSGVSTLICARLGTPVLTLEGEPQHRRTGSAIMLAAGIPDLVAKTIDEYIEKAIFYAKNQFELNKINQQLKTQDLLLYDENKFVKNLEQKLIECYERYI